MKSTENSFGIKIIRQENLMCLYIIYCNNTVVKYKLSVAFKDLYIITDQEIVVNCSRVAEKERNSFIVFIIVNKYYKNTHLVDFPSTYSWLFMEVKRTFYEH